MAAVQDYEIRFLHGDGTLSLLFVTSCASDEHARITASAMFTAEFATYEIWRGSVCVGKGVRG